MPVSRAFLEDFDSMMEDFEIARQEAWIIHKIARKLFWSDTWHLLDGPVRDAYLQNAINWEFEFYYASATA